ncbi:Fidgetin-like protein 1 [Colletotrichum siamense]|uniref:Fidgetin-like protein 1 n=1 Tax=Colletotrichum siamense TaxID=690259 RepID=A0A9P5K2H0_COLSI|nr:Fidgetin-like protein 1 [Colletotrichum siamense]KAF4855773.1 Fidgetin-like protein 1 [Colletotrichum siamense]
MSQEEPPRHPFLLLLPPTVLGYAMKDKTWRTLQVAHFSPIDWNKKAFEQLVLSPEKKELIEAVIRGHISTNDSTDVIEGKGKGVIILLHGGPGTGKTLTAESVAELAEKPLYRVTCGDIGTDPEKVEKYLNSVLFIGGIWKAVVLLDESDVFLEERERTDFKRNALVSVFLRVLEYYEGILILTSNRVGLFDEAFKSRMQLALHYPPVDKKGRVKIWNNFINLLAREQLRVVQSEDGSPPQVGHGEKVNIEELRENLDVLAGEKLNGRQIRNAITTARQLARFRNKAMGFEHLEQTIRIANDFEDA